MLIIDFILYPFGELGNWGIIYNNEYAQVFLLLATSTLILFARIGLYRAILRYLSVHALVTLVLGCLASKQIGKPGIAQRLCGSLQVDITKTMDLLNWKPPYSVTESMKKTADAYLNSLNNKK